MRASDSAWPDQSSVPRTPNAIGARHELVELPLPGGARAATFAAPSVERNALEPSGNAAAVGVGVQVLEPEPVEVGFSSRTPASRPRGCHEAKTSWVKPGAVRPSTS